MTVASTSNRKTYTGNGVTTSFATSPVVFFATSDLKVYVVTTATGAATLLTENTHYTATGGSGSTGTVDLSGGASPYGAPSASQTLVIVRDLPLTQEVDFVNNEASDAEVAEQALDRLTMFAQQLSARLDRAFALADSDVSGASLVIPTPTAGAVLAWNTAADALENVILADLSAYAISPFAATLLDDTDAATARTTLGAAASGANTDITSVYLNNTGLKVKDTNASHGLSIVPGSNITADRTLTLTTGDADRALTLTGDASISGTNTGDQPVVAVRQSLQSSAVDSSGYCSLLSAGAGLNFNVDASPTPAVIAFANGFGASGASDLVSVLSADQANQGSLAANNTNFVYADYASPTSVTWGQCLIPPQYGYAFDRTQNSILNFEGTNGATTTTDDFGNTWAFAGNAQISTADKKFGSSSLKLDGTGDYIESTSFTSFGDGGWTVEGWVNLAALPTAGQQFNIFNFGQSSTILGLELALFNSAGSYYLELYASSNASTQDIASPSNIAISAPTTSTWYHYAVTFDALAGVYRVYWNGVQQGTVSSILRICSVSKVRLGERIDATTQQWNGYMDGFRVTRACLYPGGTTFTPQATAPAVSDYKVHWFDIPNMTMREVTAASASAGTNPTFTTRNRLFVGEQDTNGSTVTATRNYAIQGRYSATQLQPANSTTFNLSHNLGVTREWQRHQILAKVNGAAFAQYQDAVAWTGTYTYPLEATSSVIPSRNVWRGATGSGGVMAAAGNIYSGANATMLLLQSTRAF